MEDLLEQRNPKHVLDQTIDLKRVLVYLTNLLNKQRYWLVTTPFLLNRGEESGI